MADKQSKRQKYVSLRKALQELKVNEEDFKTMVERGYIHPVYEGDEAKFNQDEIFKVSRHINAAGRFTIEDEELYRSTDTAGIYDSLFLTGTHEARPSDLSPSKEQTGSETEKTSGQEENRKKTTESPQMSREAVKEADMNSPNISIPYAAPVRSSDNIRGVPPLSHIFYLMQRITRRFSWVLIAFLFVVILAIALSTRDSPQPAPNLYVVTLSRVENSQFVPQIILEGRVVGTREMPVYANIEGEIVTIYHPEGAPIEKGAILAEIENPNFEKALEAAQQYLLKAELSLMEAEIALQRAVAKISGQEKEAFENFRKDLEQWKKQNPVLSSEDQMKSLQELTSSKKDLYHLCMAELHYQSAFQDFKIAEQNLNDVRPRKLSAIKAPCAGILMELNIVLHERITPYTRVAKIVDPSSKVVEAESAYRVPEGSSAIVKMHNEEKFSGKVVSVSHFHEPRTIRLQIDKDMSAVPFGAKSLITIVLPPKPNTILVPRGSIVFSENSGSPVIFWATPEESEKLYRIHSIPVNLGMSNDEFYEVKEGLSGGEMLVIGCSSGMRSLQDGMIVIADSAL